MPFASLIAVVFLSFSTHARTSTQSLVDRPWLNSTLPNEQRLQLFLAHLDSTQKYAMVQGDTELDENGTGINPCIGVSEA